MSRLRQIGSDSIAQVHVLDQVEVQVQDQGAQY